MVRVIRDNVLTTERATSIRRLAYLVTCEHGGNRIPTPYRGCFAGAEAVLHTHRGYDPGALPMARGLARKLGAPLIASTTSRLLIELNRSPWHPLLFSEFTRPLDAAARAQIRARYYTPYRDEVEAAITHLSRTGACVIHLSSHSFTPELHGVIRHADVGLLYDPQRLAEKAFCRNWKHRLAALAPQLRVRLNYPYRGNSDGLTAYLRRRFAPNRYLGVELEINQRFYMRDRAAWNRLRRAILISVEHAVANLL